MSWLKACFNLIPLEKSTLLHMFLALFGKKKIPIYFNIDLGFCPIASPTS